MKRYRRLRRLAPDPELVPRRAAGETLRALARDYGVAPSTLARYFARPEVGEQLNEAGRQLRSARRAAAVRRRAEQEQEREVRRRAQQQAELAREVVRARASLAATRRRRRSVFEAWLDEHDARLPWTRADLRTASDDLAAGAVAAGGGIAAVIEATGLRTRENVLRSIDPAILVRAFSNDAAARAAAAAAPDCERLRRLLPDAELVRRRAAGETLRCLAADYGVAHTTLSGYFRRAKVAKRQRRVGPRVQAKPR